MYHRFVDHYEELQVSPRADVDTINRVFRHLAKRYHPDNADSGDPERFGRIMEAYELLIDPTARAAYDLEYERHRTGQWRLVSEAADDGTLMDDQEVRTKLLSLLYIKRKREPRNPGMGDYNLATLLDVPVEQLEFHIWYLRSKGWINREESGELAITVTGVDQVEDLRAGVRSQRLLEKQPD